MSFLFPSIKDSHHANRACDAAAGVSFFIVLVMGIIVWLKTSGKTEWGPTITPLAYINIGVFFIVGFGFKFHSRLIAIAGTSYYIIQKAVMLLESDRIFQQALPALIFSVIFIYGTRGAFFWHILRKKEIQSEEDIPVKPNKEKKQIKVPQNLPRTIVLLLILVSLGAGAFFYLGSNEQASNIYSGIGSKVKSFISSITPKSFKKIGPAPDGKIVKLELRSGRTFEGVLVDENKEGYWLFIEGTGKVYFSPGEILKVE